MYVCITSLVLLRLLVKSVVLPTCACLPGESLSKDIHYCPVWTERDLEDSELHFSDGGHGLVSVSYAQWQIQGGYSGAVALPCGSWTPKFKTKCLAVATAFLFRQQ